MGRNYSLCGAKSRKKCTGRIKSLSPSKNRSFESALAGIRRCDTGRTRDDDFNRDYHVAFTKEELATGKVNHNFNLEAFPGTDAPGISVFYKDTDGNIFRTYSAYARGTETTLNTYNYLDYVPKRRDEDGLAFTMSWLRHHDRYADGYLADADKPYWPADAVPAR